MDGQIRFCPKCGKTTSYSYSKHRYICDCCDWEEEIPEENIEESAEDRNIRELFLSKVCKNYPCGSQRCDGGPEWVNGCKLFQEFKNEIDIMSDKILKK